MFATRHLFRLIAVRHVGRHKLRTLLTLLGLIVGVATFIFGPTLAASITSAFDASISDIAGHADLEITGPDEGFRQRTLSIVRGTDGVALAAPQAQTAAVLSGQSESLVIFGIDPSVEWAVRSYLLTDGRFIQRAGQVLFTTAYARERDLQLSDHVTLIAANGSRTFEVVGLLAASGIGRLNNGDVAIVRYQDAQDLRGSANLDEIAITLKPGTTPDIAIDRLRASLPDNLKIEAMQDKRGPLEDIRNVVTFVMGFASLMLLSVGVTLVYNTMTVAVAQRCTEIGVLRALGVSRRSVRNLFLLEAAVLGAVGTTLGIAAGYALVQSAGQALDLGAVFNTGASLKVDVSVPSWLPIAAVIAGIGLPVIAAWLPSRSAARIDPIEALSGVRAETDFMRVNRGRIIMAIALLAVSIYLLVNKNQGQSMPQIVTGELLMLPGVLLLLPGLIAALGRIVPALMQRLFGVTGLLAAEHLMKRPKRMTATATVMLISAWAAIVVSSGNFGYRQFVDEWNASQNVWDLTIAGAGPSPFRSSVSLPTTLIDQLVRRRDIAAVVTERRKTIETPRGNFEIRAIDLTAYQAQGARFLWDKGDEAAAHARLIDTARPAVLLSSFASFTQDLQPGDTITFDTPRGPVQFEIAGTILSAIDPVAIGEASLIMDRALYRRVWHDDRVDRLMIKLVPGANPQAVRRDLQHDHPDGGFAIVDPAQLSASIDAAIFNMSITSQVLSLLLLATMTLGIANTLVIEVLDRRREMGLLRALGLRGRQVAFSLMLEVTLLVIIACALGIPMAIYTNYANTLGMGEIFAIRFVLNPIEVAASLSLILMAATTASYLPARQAGRVDVLEALHYE